MRSNKATPLSSQATASPSMMQERERRRSNASTKRQFVGFGWEARHDTRPEGYAATCGLNKMGPRLIQRHTSQRPPLFAKIVLAMTGRPAGCGKSRPVAPQSAGRGAHVSGELFKMMAGINMVHVPYR